MSISNQVELEGIQKISEVVALTLKAMIEFAKPGITTRELDDFGGDCLAREGARSAPRLTYQFPGYTCISVNNEIAHGVPSSAKVLTTGDLVNIDVSAELNGFYADNGSSFVLGADVNGHELLVQTSRRILNNAISSIRGGVKIAEIGRLIERAAKKKGFTVIRNLTGHGVGRELHEAPFEIPNYYDRNVKERFRKNMVIAVETFISTTSTHARELADGWTFVGNKGGYVAQHEHTILVTDQKPIILTALNGI